MCDEAIFQVQTRTVPGRPVQVLAADLRPNVESRGSGLVVVAVSGTPPTEHRKLVLFPSEPVSNATRAAPVTVEVTPDIVAFDCGAIDSAPGTELVLLSASELRILQPFTDNEPRVIPLRPPLPLPPRARELSRLPFLGNWSGRGVLEALIPTLNGAELLSFDEEERKALPLPLLAEYLTPDERPPAYHDFLSSTITWPTLAQGDNNGDGRPDLFALSRFAVWIYQTDAKGLADAPSYRSGLRLFSPAEELRHR